MRTKFSWCQLISLKPDAELEFQILEKVWQPLYIRTFLANIATCSLSAARVLNVAFATISTCVSSASTRPALATVIRSAGSLIQAEQPSTQVARVANFSRRQLFATLSRLLQVETLPEPLQDSSPTGNVALKHCGSPHAKTGPIGSWIGRPATGRVAECRER